jgi:hypothetical protein
MLAEYAFGQSISLGREALGAERLTICRFTLTRTLIGLGVMSDCRIHAVFVAGRVPSENLGRIFFFGFQITQLSRGLGCCGDTLTGRLGSFIAGRGCERCESLRLRVVFGFLGHNFLRTMSKQTPLT